MNGKISIVIPTYYRNDKLDECLQSVLRQEYDPVEIIVVDDSGEAHAESVVDAYERVTYVSLSENRGAQAARNRGLEESSGEFVQFLDDDDKLLDSKLEKQAELLRSRPDVGVAYCGLTLADGTCHYPDPDVRGEVLEHALAFRDNTWKTSTLLVDRSALEAIAPLDRDSEGADDVRMRIELAQVTEFDCINDPAVFISEEGDRRGDSLAAVKAHKRILREYDDLYESFDPEVRRHAVAETYAYEGRYYLRERRWSGQAVRAFALSAYCSPDEKVLRVGEFLASLLGRPGMTLGRRVQRRLLG